MPVTQVPPTLKGKIKKYLAARQAAISAEETKEALKPFVEKWLKASPTKRREFGVVTLELLEIEQEKLSAELAEAKFGAEALKPCYKTSKFTRIHVK